MKATPLNLTLSQEARKRIESYTEPGIVLGLMGNGFEWQICGYDNSWLERNLERIQLSGNPFFYNVGSMTLAIQFMQHVEELNGKHIEIRDGKLARE